MSVIVSTETGPFDSPHVAEPRPFDGLTVIVTGEIEGLSRDAANTMIEHLGGKPVASVSGRTGLVVMGDGAGVSKMAKTRSHNLLVLDDQEFLALIRAFVSGGWDGAPPGIPVKDYDARHLDPEEAARAEAEAERSRVPFSERHLVGKAVLKGEALMWCSCGQKWTDVPQAEMTCPDDEGTSRGTTAASIGKAPLAGHPKPSAMPREIDPIDDDPELDPQALRSGSPAADFAPEAPKAETHIEANRPAMAPVGDW